MEFTNLQLTEIIKNINLLVLSHSGRTGSAFMQSLLDEHSEIISLPCLHYKYDLYSDYKRLGQNIRTFYEENEGLFNPNLNFFSTLEMPSRSESTNIVLDVIPDNRGKFFEYFDELIIHNSIKTNKDFLVCLHLAWVLAYRKDLSGIKYILFHHHSLSKPGELDQILAEWNEAKFIIMTRDLLDNATSCNAFHQARMITHGLKFTNVEFLNNFLSLYKIWLFVFELSYKITSDDNLAIIDIGALNRLKEKAMQILCDWLQIKFEPNLLCSTVMGVKWPGNSLKGTPIYSLYNKEPNLENLNVAENKNSLTPDQFKICTYFGNQLSPLFGYKTSDADHGRFYEVFIPMLKYIIPLPKSEYSMSNSYKNSFNKSFEHMKYVSKLPLPFAQYISALYNFVKDNILYNLLQKRIIIFDARNCFLIKDLLDCRRRIRLVSIEKFRLF